MNNKIILVLLYLVYFCLTQSTLSLKFPKIHYVNQNSEKKVIEVISSIPNNIMTLNINHIKNKNSQQCTPKNDDEKIFYCFISSIGEYNFNYIYNGKTGIYAKSIFVVSSYKDLFTITPSRNSNCYFHKESISYTVQVNQRYLKSIDLNNIQIFAYSP